MFVAQYTWMFPTLKNATLRLTQRTLQIHGDLDAVRMLLPVSAMHLLESKSIHTMPVHCTSVIENARPMDPFGNLLRKTGLVDMQKYKNIAIGYSVYENILKQIDYQFFFKYFNMADTFYSWFLVTELHVWMAMTRYMAEGKNGKLIRNNIVSAMWEDTNARIENLGNISGKLKHKQIKDLSDQFNAAIIGYDEGILSDDKVLAGALWRRFFNFEGHNPEHVETLIIYIRKQICLFDNLPSHEILIKNVKNPAFKLIDIKDLCKHQ
ncbi:ubiquinol-cytochrome-c reductase complex assembly factor 1 isoform X2 [Linepithema humile]|uniref:ubiquinol-cytochrome-c reductase complex assembly factor 1 isoform X2 n=1 Tax=Linepithema humile TaxID=83485 RepID=UPI0006235D6E|nr:PREDICTED: ubiquinol-cytochrome-c reductase complex assembly factor 1 [Linepithema humile]